MTVNSGKIRSNVTNSIKSANFSGCALFGIDRAYYLLSGDLPCLSRAGIDDSANPLALREITDAMQSMGSLGRPVGDKQR